MELVFDLSREEYNYLFKPKKTKKATPADRIVLDFIQSNAKYAKVGFDADDIAKADAKQARFTASLKKLGIKSVKVTRRGDDIYLVRKSKKKGEVETDNFKWIKWED